MAWLARHARHSWPGASSAAWPAPTCWCWRPRWCWSACAATGHGGLSAIHFSGVGTGIALSALLTWALASAGLDWRAMWLGGGLLSLAGLAAVAALVAGSAGRVARHRRPRRERQRTARLQAAHDRLWPVRLRLRDHGDLHRRHRARLAGGGAHRAGVLAGASAWRPFPRWRSGSPSGGAIGVMQAFAIACVIEAGRRVCQRRLAQRCRPASLRPRLLGGTFMGMTALGLIAARDLAPADAAPLGGNTYRCLRPRPDRRPHRGRLWLRPDRQLLSALRCWLLAALVRKCLSGPCSLPRQRSA